ncbi:MAG: B12-binding domain-containing radical SAM protein [Lachnospiraceae bacterium]|nr:B12-binding domain-containing radical SAM protein [Lachnospiraceae bacterium]
MKVLLTAINAKYIHSNPAVYSLKAYAQNGKRSSDTTIEIAEYTINQPEDGILEDIYLRRPDIIGFSCYIWNIEIVRRLVDLLHQVMPDVPIWLGGPEVSFDCEAVLREMPGAKGIMVSEGERVFDRLLSCYEGSVQLVEVPGLVYRDGDTICIQPPEAPMDLSLVPFYYDDMSKFENKIVYYESSRGCPFRCSYCLSSVDKNLRFRDLELVKKELMIFLDAKVPQVKFVDRTFNCKKSHAMAIWEFIRSHDNGVTNFHFEVRADLLDEDAFDLLAQMRPGQVQLEIGVQSTNPQTLQEIRRYAAFDRIADAVRRVKAGGNIHQHLDLIAGLPWEDYESFSRSFDTVYALEPDQLQLGFLKVLKGAHMWEKQEDYGLCYKKTPPYEVLYTKWLPYEDVLRLKGVEEMVEQYYNSGQFRHTLSYLVRFFTGPFAMFEAMANRYRAWVLPGQNVNRNARYEWLLHFVEEFAPEAEEGVRVLLTYDLYLREKVKSRPAFAGDSNVWKEKCSERMSELWESERAAGRYEGPYRQFLHETHMEHFALDPMALARTGEKKAGDYWCWFDYRKKDPLNGNGIVTFR